MNEDLPGIEILPAGDEDRATRRDEDSVQKRWLWIIGIAGFLLPGICPPFTLFWTSPDGMFLVHMIDPDWSYPHLFILDMSADHWLKALSMYIVLALGAAVSAVFVWHHVVHKAEYPGWKKGMKAGILAHLLAFPLSSLIVFWFNLLAHPFQPGLENIVSWVLTAIAIMVMGPLLGIVGLLLYGWWPVPVALALGALCGWLEKLDLQKKMRREILKYP